MLGSSSCCSWRFLLASIVSGRSFMAGLAKRVRLVVRIKCEPKKPHRQVGFLASCVGVLLGDEGVGHFHDIFLIPNKFTLIINLADHLDVMWQIPDSIVSAVKAGPKRKVHSSVGFLPHVKRDAGYFTLAFF